MQSFYDRTVNVRQPANGYFQMLARLCQVELTVLRENASEAIWGSWW